MTRKDNDKEAERPHYYSQFWLDVAAGRRIIGLPKTNEDGDGINTEVLETVAPRRASRVNAPVIENESDDDYAPDDDIAEPLDEVDPNALVEPEAEEDNVDDLDLVVDDVDADADEELEPVESEPEGEDEEDEEDFFDEEEEEEEEDGSWGARGRKKARPIKKPVVKKPGKRDTRRGF